MVPHGVCVCVCVCVSTESVTGLPHQNVLVLSRRLRSRMFSDWTKRVASTKLETPGYAQQQVPLLYTFSSILSGCNLSAIESGKVQAAAYLTRDVVSTERREPRDVLWLARTLSLMLTLQSALQ